MPTKFKFDFNEDAEPVAELHRLRAALAKRYKTTEALAQYYRDSLAEKGIVIKNGKIVRRPAPNIPDEKNKSLPKPRKRGATTKTKMAKAR